MPRIDKIKNITNLDKSYKSVFKRNILLISIVIVFIIGMVYGTILITYESGIFNETLSYISKEFIDNRTNQSILQTFTNSFISSISILFILYITGFWAISHPLTYSIILFKGLGLGVIMSYMYSMHNITGIAFCIALIIPPTLVSLIAFIIGAKQTLCLSSMILSSFKNKSNNLNLKIIKLYTLKYLVLFSFILISSAIDSLCTIIFAKFFNL